LTHLRHFIPPQTLLTLYNSLILPHLLYGVLLWGHKSKIVFKLQKRAIRIISKVKYNAHTEPLFKKFNILKFHDTVKLQEYKFVHKLTNNKLPNFFQTFTFTRHVDIHNYATRRNDLLIIPRVKYQISVCSIRYRLAHIINYAPPSISNRMNTHSIKGLCFYFKKMCIESYEMCCNIQGCFVCS